jgi:hypothetical protein
VLLASESNLCKRPTGVVGDVDSTPEPERVLGLVGDWVGEDDGLGTVEWTQGGGEGDVGLRVPIVPGRKHGVACSIITRARAGVSICEQKNTHAGMDIANNDSPTATAPTHDSEPYDHTRKIHLCRRHEGDMHGVTRKLAHSR